MADKKHIRITLRKSMIARTENHKACLRGLGLRRRHQTVEVIDTPCNRGMINKVYDMLIIEEGVK